jgi:hypothetical protein
MSSEFGDGWLGHSAAVPQVVAFWGFAALSRQPPQMLKLFIVGR